MSHVEALAETSQCLSNSKVLRFFGLCPQNDVLINNKFLLTYLPTNLLTRKRRVAFTLAEGATHVDISHNCRRIAFTLAEVLITLGVIGVVAAFTIPTIAKNYYKHTVEVQLAATYAELSEAIKKSELENGPILYWDYNMHPSFPSTRSWLFAEKYILPYLDKNYKTCWQRDQSWCYKSNLPKGHSPVYRYGPSQKLISFSVYGLEDQCHSDFPGTCTPHYFARIIVDVDGNRGPSKSGVDVHHFLLASYTKITPWAYTKCNGLYSGLNINGYYASYFLSDDAIKSYCKGEHEGANIGMGDTCTVWVHRNGWKFPKDYPIRF